MSKLPFIDITPKTPQHSEFVRRAILSKDQYALALLRGNTGKPIRYVTGLFYFLLMATSWSDEDASDEVVIYSPQARQDSRKWAVSRGESVDTRLLDTTPLDTYDFILSYAK